MLGHPALDAVARFCEVGGSACLFDAPLVQSDHVSEAHPCGAEPGVLGQALWAAGGPPRDLRQNGRGSIVPVGGCRIQPRPPRTEEGLDFREIRQVLAGQSDQRLLRAAACEDTQLFGGLWMERSGERMRQEAAHPAVVQASIVSMKSKEQV